MIPKKIVFEPGCFDNFEGTQEELEAFMAEITKLFESGEYVKNSVPISQEEWDEFQAQQAKRKLS